MINFKIGDKVFHKSNTSIKWIIEKIDDDEVYCSTVIKETFEQKKEIFIITSIEKYTEPKIYASKRSSNNHW